MSRWWVLVCAGVGVDGVLSVILLFFTDGVVVWMWNVGWNEAPSAEYMVSADYRSCGHGRLGQRAALPSRLLPLVFKFSLGSYRVYFVRG